MEGFGLPALELWVWRAGASSIATCPQSFMRTRHITLTPLDTDDMARSDQRHLSRDKLRNSLIKKVRHSEKILWGAYGKTNPYRLYERT